MSPRAEEFLGGEGLAARVGGFAESIGAQAPEQYDGHEIKCEKIRQAVVAENDRVYRKSDEHRVVERERGLEYGALLRRQL